jgi:hypothetical protein
MWCVVGFFNLHHHIEQLYLLLIFLQISLGQKDALGLDREVVCTVVVGITFLGWTLSLLCPGLMSSGPGHQKPSAESGAVLDITQTCTRRS